MTLQAGESLPESFDFRDHLGLQLYSLRAQFAEDPEAALDLVKGFGVVEVEGAGNYRDWTPAEYLHQITSRGLKIPSSHVSYDAMVKDANAVIERMKAIGVKVVFCPWIPHEGEYTRADNAAAIERFNEWGALFRDAGIRFGYHPHGYEFQAGETKGLTLFDELIRGCDPELVAFEMDVFWVVHAGVDPVKLLEKYPDRWIALHIKDIRKGAPTGLSTGQAPSTDVVAVGSGQVDWKSVISTARRLGVRYYFIEDETLDPLKNIPRSIQYLRQLDIGIPGQAES